MAVSDSRQPGRCGGTRRHRRFLERRNLSLDGFTVAGGYPQNLRMRRGVGPTGADMPPVSPDGRGEGCQAARRTAGRQDGQARRGDGGPDRARSVAGRHRRLHVPARMARRQRRGGAAARLSGGNAEAHAEPTIGPKSGPCGANDWVSRQRRSNRPPSLVERHSPDKFACPDVLPFFYCFVVRVVCRSTTYARSSSRSLCSPGSIPSWACSLLCSRRRRCVFGCGHRCLGQPARFLRATLLRLVLPVDRL